MKDEVLDPELEMLAEQYMILKSMSFEQFIEATHSGRIIMQEDGSRQVLTNQFLEQQKQAAS